MYGIIRGVVKHPPTMISLPTMSKKDLATLIDAYADAKASRNQHLVNSMVAQLEQALDSIFPGETEEVKES